MKRKRMETAEELRKIEEIKPRKKRNIRIYIGKIMEMENKHARNRITPAEETMTLLKKIDWTIKESYTVIQWEFGEIIKEEGRFKAKKYLKENKEIKRK